jgi:tetratricopeptide (TPR) repeat protein
MNDHSRRLDQLRRRILADPASVLFVGLSEEYRRLGQYREAVEVAEAGLRHHPTYSAGRLSLARAYVSLDCYAEAKRELGRVLEAIPDNLAALRLIAGVCRQLGAVDEAVAHYRTLIQLSPSDTESRQALDALVPSGQPTSSQGLLGLDDTGALDRFVRSDDVKRGV